MKSLKSLVVLIAALSSISSFAYETKCKTSGGVTTLTYTKLGKSTVLYDSSKFETKSEAVYDDPEAFCQDLRDAFDALEEQFGNDFDSGKLACQGLRVTSGMLRNVVTRIFLYADPLSQNGDGTPVRFLWKSSKVDSVGVGEWNETMNYCNSVAEVVRGALDAKIL